MPEPILSDSLAEAVDAGRLDANLERGRALYEVCSECHLPSGAGLADGTMPGLAGQHAEVLIKQMLDIRSGLRRNPAMYPYVARLDGAQEVVDVSAYIATLPVAEDNGVGSGSGLERGKQLYAERCASCHGAQGEGQAQAYYPKLAGQHYRYLVRQLVDVAAGRRGNADPAMTQAVVDLSAADVARLADYVSRIHLAPRSGR